jgi:hypothetical protein
MGCGIYAMGFGTAPPVQVNKVMSSYISGVRHQLIMGQI